MGNLRKLATFKSKLAKIITLNRKSKEFYYFKSTVKVKFSKIINLDRKSTKIVTLNPLLSQNKQKLLL